MTIVKARESLINKKIDEEFEHLVEIIVHECLDSNPRFAELKHQMVILASEKLEDLIEKKLRELVKNEK